MYISLNMCFHNDIDRKKKCKKQLCNFFFFFTTFLYILTFNLDDINKRKNIFKNYIYSILLLILVRRNGYSYNDDFYVKKSPKSITREKKYMCQRIIVEREDAIWKQDFEITLNQSSYEKLGLPFEKKIPYSKRGKEIKKLYDLTKRVTEIWKELLEQMEVKYLIKTHHMNHKWRDFMWESKWALYLEHVYKYINDKLNEPHVPIVEKEVFIQKWFNNTSHDFNYFINFVFERWKHKVKSACEEYEGKKYPSEDNFFKKRILKFFKKK
ncbi:exported protein (hyp11) [Plasmodium gaboni]|uniref:Exported protein (Hyp11) n=1 Tax=Plasmodium gaboni TaxID=647221 RepID=A0A151LWA6_9APIC|nr:exported protein (hyp11) [Plasmodium gaboni]KYO03456.1 exported protein (hyp11) [Plasmodium gaboni]